MLWGFIFHTANGQVGPPNCPDLEFTSEQCCFTPGSVITFNWQGGCTNASVDLCLVDPNTLIKSHTIVSGISNSGFYTWTVPANIPNGNYLLYIDDPANAQWAYGPTVTIADDCLDKKCDCAADFGYTFKGDGCSISFGIKNTCKIQKILWDFGDGNTSGNSNPTHTYTQNGTYTVCLTVLLVDQSGNLCPEKICKKVKVETCIACCPVTPVFTYDISKCRVKFTSLNLQNNCSKVIAWDWDFGDNGGTSTQDHPVYDYNQDGTYNVCLTATIQTSDGLTFQTIVCRTLVIDECEDTGDCCPLQTKFNYLIDSCEVRFAGALLPDSCRQAVNWSWDFGDGTSSNQQNPVKVFQTSNSYNVCLTVQYTDTPFCQANYCEIILLPRCDSVSGPCAVSGLLLSQTPSSCNQAIGTFTVQGTNGHAPYTYAVNNGPFQNSGLFSNLSAGVYNIQVVDALGCSASLLATIVANVFVPVNAGSDVTICPGNGVLLNAGPMGTFQWSPTTGLSCSNCPNPIANPPSTTTYTLQHIDLNGCSSSDQVTVMVGDSFDLNLPDHSICPGTTIDLNPNPANGQYFWQPSAGLSCSNCPNPQATLTQDMSYVVHFFDGNCTGTDTVHVTMDSTATPDFTWQSQGALLVDFMASPLGQSSYSWDFGDPASGQANQANGVQVSHNFSTPNQNYTVCLTVVGNCGPVRVCHPLFIDEDCAKILNG